MAEDRIIASYTAEQTARFLGGGELGAPTWHDPELAERMRRHRNALRRAFNGSIDLLAAALHGDSRATEARLRELWAGAESGDPHARQLFGVMLTELLAQALTPGP